MNYWSYVSESQKRQWNQENGEADQNDEDEYLQIVNFVRIGDPRCFSYSQKSLLAQLPKISYRPILVDHFEEGVWPY